MGLPRAARTAAASGFALLTALLLAPALSPAVAVAEPPGRLATPISDTVGALNAGDRREVEQAQAQLQSEHGVQLWVAYVETFEGMSGQQWSDQTAALSGLAGNDLLFAVAVADRSYGYSVAANMPVSDDALADIMATRVEPELSAGDWAGAVIALVEGIDEATDTGGSRSTGDVGAGMLPLLLVAAVVVCGLLLVGSLLRRRRRGAQGQSGAAGASASAGGVGAAGPPAVAVEPIEQLRQRAAAALIDVDDCLKTSEQELGFAEAQFNAEATAPFATALEESKQEVVQAFQLQRQAQEAASGGPDRGGAERELLEQVISLCTAADERLDQQVESFDALRDLERSIDTVLPGLADTLQGLQARQAASATTMQGLAVQWPPAALANVQKNLGEANERLDFAKRSIDAGMQSLASGDRGAAVAEARATEEALGQARTLLDNVDRAPENLDMAQRAIAALMTEADRDVAEAAQLGLPPSIAPTHQHVVETLAWARKATSAGNYDPIEMRRALEESDNALEAALAPLREAEASRRRAHALLQTATETAHASIRAADDFITTRRGVVGAEARSLLAAAQRQFGEAQVATDPVEALRLVQSAETLSDQAQAQAQQDEARYRDEQSRGSGGLGGPGSLTSVILGGILVDAMTSGRGGGLGRGGFGGGGLGGGGFGVPGGGRRGPSSFGGGGTRGRRSGGGRF